MFGFFWKKKVEVEKVKDYKHAIKAIKVFSILNEWNKAFSSIKEIRNKEDEDYRHLIEEIDKISWVMAEYEKLKLSKEFNKKINELNRLEDHLKERQRKVSEKMEEKRFEIRLKNTETDLNILLKTNKNQEAMALLTSFLELNRENPRALKFYNKKKTIVLKNVEKSNINEENKLKQNIKLEALKLIWEKVNIEEEIEIKKSNNIFSNTFKWIKENVNLIDKIRKRRLFDEVSLLVDEESTQKLQLASEKLERIHKWLTKELIPEKTLWYDFYWKILWADKISWDTFWFNDDEEKQKYNFFLWDATWHWIRAWFIVTLFSMAFRKHNTKSIKEIAFNINNELKQDLKSRNFITWVLFEIQKKDLSKIDYVWMWHEPMFIYRAKTKEVEVLIWWWLAAWIRIIKNPDDVKIKSLNLEDWDIIMIYSDWAVELKNEQWEFFWIEKLKETFKKVASLDKNVKNIYDYMMTILKNFKLWSNFLDDATILLIKRDSNKDIIKKVDEYISTLELKSSLSKRDLKKFEWKTKEEINEEVDKIEKKMEIKNAIKILENLYYTWETLTLKQEAIRFIKKWLIDKKINFYLKKAIANETTYKISQKQQKIENKFNVLNELLKKWDYSTVIRECEDIIIKDGNI